MIAYDDIDYDELYESFVNGNRTWVAERLKESSNPAWSVLRLVREMISAGDETLDYCFVDEVVSLQSLVERRLVTP
jgi:hypothetical protein